MNIPKPINWDLKITPTFSKVYASLEKEPEIPEIPKISEPKKNKKIKIPTLKFTKSFKQEYFKPLQHS
jgi:hypothetical protein